MSRIPSRVTEIAEAIKVMKIRGAGRIARAAAEALKIAAEEYVGPVESQAFLDYMEKIGSYLKSTRPTAVSLPNAVGFVLLRLRRGFEAGLPVPKLRKVVIDAAETFIRNSRLAVEIIGRIGSKRIRDGEVILTHCNSSAAVSVILHAHREGKRIKVYATETRPRFQGYITYKILKKAGVKVTLIPDSAIRFFMKDIDKVVVGADTVTANGAVVNKIGTSLIALAAHEARVRVFVAAETYKFSPMTVLGELVEIEERSPLEVVSKEYLDTNPAITIRNPAFDVTPPEYIDAIITEKGLIPPKAAILVLREEFGRIIEEGILSIVEESFSKEF